jgi:hypothetical protein
MLPGIGLWFGLANQRRVTPRRASGAGRIGPAEWTSGHSFPREPAASQPSTPSMHAGDKGVDDGRERGQNRERFIRRASPAAAGREVRLR